MDRKRDTLEFQILLREIEPSVWRRIEVPASYSFWDLHVAIQDVMGWQDYHLHAFRVRNRATGQLDQIGIPNEDRFEDEPEFLAGWVVPVADYLSQPGDSAVYEYDFGDGWEHHLILDAVQRRRAGVRYPRCLAGGRACPPEDCGGPGGYAEFLETIADPDHEEHASTLAWVGGRFNPEAFDCRRVRFADPKRRWRIAFAGG